MRGLLRERFPEHGILGEEFGPERAEAEWLWVLDPIDGTRAFVTGRPLFGTLVALLHRGRIVTRTAKHHLPNYGVFDEYRYFVRGDRLPIFRLHGVDVAIAICEDLWQEGGRVPAARAAGAGLLLSVNASPYEREKDDTRLELVRKRAQEAGCATAYVAMTGGQPVDGPLSPADIARQCAAEGVARIVVVSDEPTKYPANYFAGDVAVHHRDQLDAVHQAVAQVPALPAATSKSSMA